MLHALRGNQEPGQVSEGREQQGLRAVERRMRQEAVRLHSSSRLPLGLVSSIFQEILEIQIFMYHLSLLKSWQLIKYNVCTGQQSNYTFRLEMASRQLICYLGYRK